MKIKNSICIKSSILIIIDICNLAHKNNIESERLDIA